jgi:hypothetical protein
VCWRCKFALLEALLEPWRTFEELWKSSEALEAISSLEVHKCWIGALWRYFEALDVHVSTFQHCKSSFELVECILSV